MIDSARLGLPDFTPGSVWLVGAYLFRNHADFMASLSQRVDPQIEYPLLNDPQFRDPETSGNE